MPREIQADAPSFVSAGGREPGQAQLGVRDEVAIMSLVLIGLPESLRVVQTGHHIPIATRADARHLDSRDAEGAVGAPAFLGRGGTGRRRRPGLEFAIKLKPETQELAAI